MGRTVRHPETIRRPVRSRRPGGLLVLAGCNDAPAGDPTEAAVVEALLDGANVVGGGSSPGYRVAASGVDPAAVPGILEAPRNGTVRASVRRDGRVTRIEVRYEATLDGRPVAVEQTLEWTRPSEPVRPAWADG